MISREERAAYLRERADKWEKLARACWDSASKMAEAIPMGQPILVGHHSEKRDRSYRGRIDAKYQKANQAFQKAKELRNQAYGVENCTAILSHESDAVQQLQAKIEKAKAEQEKMIAANKLVRKKDVPALVAMFGESAGKALMEPDFCGRLGFPDYMLSNNRANIKRMEERLKSLQATKAKETTEEEKEGFRVVRNTEAFRLQLFFPGKPDEKTRETLKRNGFRWAPSESAWQRHLNPAGEWALKEVEKALTA